MIARLLDRLTDWVGSRIDYATAWANDTDEGDE